MEKLIIIPPEEKLLVVGDIHGDLDSLKNIIKNFDKSKNLLFLGDYADRGPYSRAVYELLFKLIKEYSGKIFLLKGNHEKYIRKNGEILPTFFPHDFFDQLKKNEIEEYFLFWEGLPICALVPEKYLFLHGGISTRIKSLNDIKKPSEKIEEDIIWSDPVEIEGEYPNPRGAGVIFGKDVTENLCKKLNIKTIIRSHQPYIAKNGIAFHHNNRILTLSSTTVYGGKSAFLEIDLSSEAKNAYELGKEAIII